MLISEIKVFLTQRNHKVQEINSQAQMIPFCFQRITRPQGGGDEAYFTYVEEANDAANKVSQRPGARPAGKRIVNKVLTLPVITACKVVTYKRIGISTFPGSRLKWEQIM